MSVVSRARARFQANPASVKVATAAIVSVTLVAVLVGALLMWAFDRANYPSYGQAVWFTLQTVTTVGYGDATPTSGIGRTVAGVVMLTGIGVVTVVTAAVTSVFIEAARVRNERSRAEAAVDSPEPLEAMAATLTEIAARLERSGAFGIGRSVAHGRGASRDYGRALWVDTTETCGALLWLRLGVTVSRHHVAQLCPPGS